MNLDSQIIITQDSSQFIDELMGYKEQYRIVIIKEDLKAFSVDDAKEAIRQAHISSEKPTIIILVAKSFSTIVQNKLLKIIEEPPINTSFILICNTKSTILPTIRSRLPIYNKTTQTNNDIVTPDINSLNLKTIYEFIQQHKRTDSKEIKLIIERLLKDALKSNKYQLDEETLQLFHNSILALDIGSPSSFVLTTILMKLNSIKK
jgi:DNA polymerase-3 subunit delta'